MCLNVFVIICKHSVVQTTKIKLSNERSVGQCCEICVISLANEINLFYSASEQLLPVIVNHLEPSLCSRSSGGTI